jgi:hypothetical protein
MQLFGDLDILSFVRISRLNRIGHFNHLNAELNPICHLLVLLGAHPILYINRIRVNRLDSNIKVSQVFSNNPQGS